MLKLSCPVCGLEADETEFHPGGEAHLTRPASAQPDEISDEAFRDYLFMRQNPRGISHELWQCTRGCGKWFHAARDTVTMEFKRFYRLSDPKDGALIASKPAPAKKASLNKTGIVKTEIVKTGAGKATTKTPVAKKTAAKPKPKRKSAVKPIGKSKAADK